ncbi:ABC transporter permease [Bogoriella caseilytica]|uniref:ABC-2 type transport system permease protein n=1 Tax=Bogoriella caseilytica TaxID=56055 RepID=A0A3N2BB75_9MICO|nr:ABC transporter permease [Bogoriella caseilytica]ROR72478.1 ABC-2 type transport system permease protein [Bogoriella caseilytica]
MNLTYTVIELKRVSRDLTSMFFIAVLPALLFLIFGSVQDYSDDSAGNGNVTLYVMASMAAYGAVITTTGVGGAAAVERMQGWGRQLGLTPMRDGGYVAAKSTVALVIALIPISLIYLLGYLTGAEGTAGAWVFSALIVVAGAGVFSLYGLAVGLIFRSEAAVGAASGSLVILAFLGNLFFPLSGVMLTIAKFTPLYGFAQLARRPITEGALVSVDATGPPEFEPLWVPLVNLGAWTLVFAVACVLLVRRGRRRQ